MTTLIEHGTVIGFQDGGHVTLPDAQVAFQGNQITFVGRGYRGPVDARMDARGKLVIPGLINHHMAFGVHMQLYRLDKARPNYFNSGAGLGVQPDKAYHGGGPAPADWRASAEYAMYTTLRSGATTFVMVPNYGRHPYRGRVGSDDELVQAVAATGLRGYLALPYLSGGVRGRADGTLEWVWREEEGWQGFEQGVEFAQAYDGAADGRIRTFLFPYLLDACKPDLLKASKEAAKELGCTLKMHGAQYYHDFQEMLRRTGKTPIQWLADLGFLGPEVSLTHAVYTTQHPWLPYPVGDETDMRILAETGTTVAHCPVVFARNGVALHSFSRYVRAGIPVSLGTDTSPHDMIMEMRCAMLMSKLTDEDPLSGLAREAFDAATLGGAKALGRDDLGRLAPGAKADIVLVDMEQVHIGPVAADDPIKALVYCAFGDDVDTVIVDGKTLVQGGELLGVDVPALRERADAFNRKLTASVSLATYRGRPLTDWYEPAFPAWQG
ncbi:MAG: amidohydrolase family protein [Chloroflexi bacterium]|nr:amidohydrolase family protein [Chloroflexota bacterium]